MRAITTPTFGGPEVLSLVELPEPIPGPGEVLIRVAAAGLNGADLAQREGRYPAPPGVPAWPGLEVSGTIAALGDDAPGFAVGDEVCALLPGGGYAEFAAVDAGLVLPVPAGVTLQDAAALPEVAATVWSNVFMSAGLAAGQTLLVHGGSSGIGTMAVQLGLAAGARVIATAGSGEKVDFIEGLGEGTARARGVNYRSHDFVDEVREFSGGADVILDIVGGDYLQRNIRALAVGGTIMTIADRGGAEASVSLGHLMMKRGRIWATTLRSRPLAERRAIVAAVREHVWPLIEQGRVRPVVDSVYPADAAADAHRRMETSAHIGKILLSFAEAK